MGIHDDMSHIASADDMVDPNAPPFRPKYRGIPGDPCDAEAIMAEEEMTQERVDGWLADRVTEGQRDVEAFTLAQHINPNGSFRAVDFAQTVWNTNAEIPFQSIGTFLEEAREQFRMLSDSEKRVFTPGDERQLSLAIQYVWRAEQPKAVRMDFKTVSKRLTELLPESMPPRPNERALESTRAGKRSLDLSHEKAS